MENDVFFLFSSFPSFLHIVFGVRFGYPWSFASRYPRAMVQTLVTLKNRSCASAVSFLSEGIEMGGVLGEKCIITVSRATVSWEFFPGDISTIKISPLPEEIL